MEKRLQGQVGLTTTEKNMIAYFQTHDVKYIHEDAIYRQMGSDEEYRGRAEIGGMLHYFYHVAFDATAETTDYLITEERAYVQGYFKGRHIGEFAGMPATGKKVRVPLCVIYELKDGLIKEANIYFINDVLISQLQGEMTAERSGL